MSPSWVFEVEVYQVLILISLVLSTVAITLVAIILLGSRGLLRYLRASLLGKKAAKYRKRYLVVLFYPPGFFKTPEELEAALKECVRQSLGLIYLSGIDPRVVFINPKESRAIIRFNGEFKTELLASLACASRLGFKIVPIWVAGSFKSAKKRLS